MLAKGLAPVFLLCGTLMLGANPGAEQDPAPPEEGPEAPAAEAAFDVDAALKRLGDDEFDVRRQAQEELMTWGMTALDQGIDALYDVYTATDDPEVKFRSRQVLKRLVIVKQPWDGEGYLGIQMETGQVKGEDGELHPAVVVTQVREGTGAQEAGLVVNDVITGVDRVVFNDLAPTRMFADYIRSKKPGDTIQLHLKREGERKVLPAVLRRRSPLLDRLGQWGTQLNLPDQADLDEADFREWFEEKLRAERLQKARPQGR